MFFKTIKKYLILITCFSTFVFINNTVIAGEGGFIKDISPIECKVVYAYDGVILPGCEDHINIKKTNESDNTTQPNDNGGVGEGGNRCRRNPGACGAKKGHNPRSKNRRSR